VSTLIAPVLRHLAVDNQSLATKRSPEPETVRNGEPLKSADQRILVVEDSQDARLSMQNLLATSLGVQVDAVADGRKALETLGERPYSIVITDLKMPHVNGIELMKELQERRLDVTVIVTTGYGSIEEAVHAMQLGAYEYLTKPADPKRLCLVIQRALRERTLHDQVVALRKQIAGRHTFQNVLSKSPHMLQIFDLISHVAETQATVMIEGETGTGKEQIARAIHQASSVVRTGPLVAVSCAALPETLLESELLGHEKGAFTGASSLRKGRFEQAHGGTIFLDEVGDIPASMQVKLLRVLQERRFERVGGAETVEVDVRVIGATNRSLEQLVKDGTLREDLFYRLNVVKIDLPPLRDRSEDVPLLATHFAQKYARPGQNPCQITPEAMELLLSFSWPGNVRQLENAIERACVTARDGQVRPENLPPELKGSVQPATAVHVDLSRPLPMQLADIVAAFEERYLRKALKRTRGHVGRCAAISGLSRRSVTEKISHYKIDRTAYTRD
jgi:DNA-binding NtrC family response regulator